MPIVTEPRRDHDRPAVVYGVVRFAPGGNRQVTDVVITFVSASAADDFAAEQGWPEYEVAPVRFFVHERQSAVAEVPPPTRWTGDSALPKQGHRSAADPAGPPGSAAPSPAGQAETAVVGAQEASAAQPAADRQEARRVSVTSWGLDRWAVALRVGSDPVEAFRAVGRLPAGLVFTAAYGDVDVVLVYGPGAGGDAPPARAPTVLETALGAEPAGLVAARWMTAGEREAFRAGYAAAVDGIRRALA